MIPRELFKQIKKIEIRTTKLVNSVFGGSYESVFKGQGMEFAEVREYYPGDDIRSIDWNVTARTGSPHVKVFHEEREMTVFLAVDVSSSLYFGSNTRLKSEVAAELCALLAFSAIRNNDKIGLLMFSEEIEKFIPIKKGKQHVLRVVREILGFRPKNCGTNVGLGLETLFKTLTRRAVIFVISDFQDRNFEKPLKVLAQNHDVIAVNIYDPRELEIPDVGYVSLEDAETGEVMIINTRRKRFRDLYKKIHTEKRQSLNTLFRSKGIDSIDIDVSKPYVIPLRSFFQTREKRR